MKKHPDKAQTKATAVLPKGGEITDAELSQFLRRLALIFQGHATGNPELGRALNKLAGRLNRKELPPKMERRAPRVQENQLKDSKTGFAALGLEEIQKLLDDDKATKQDLITLAYVRFSIPKARLLRLNTFEVREIVRSAILHETSLDNISEEARRIGISRSS